MTKVVSCSYHSAISVMNTVSFFSFFLLFLSSIIPTLLSHKKLAFSLVCVVGRWGRREEKKRFKLIDFDLIKKI